MTSITIDEAFSESIKIMRNYSESFYRAFKQLPEEKFLGVASVYAFCRTVDDLADEVEDYNYDDNLAELNRLESDLLKIERNEVVKSNYPWWSAFELTVKKFSIPISSFLMQIQGQKSDLEFEDIQNEDELIQYSRHVAGSVGLMLLPIITTDSSLRNDAKLQQSCESLGIAMQITNILRDVGEDLELRNRLYLPLSLLEKHDLTKEKIKNLKNNLSKNADFENFVKLWEELAKQAEQAYDNFNASLRKIDSDSRLPVYSSSIIYRAILDEVRKNNYDCLTKKNFTSTAKKAKLLSEGLLYTRSLGNE